MRRFSVVILLVISFVVPCQAVITDLRGQSLGLNSGNYGSHLVIDGFADVSAVIHVLPLETTGSVYLDYSKGLGVQTAHAHGRRGVSGVWNIYIEALIFDFATEITASSLTVGLTDYSRDVDDTVIQLTFVDGGEMSFSESHPSWNSAISSTGSGGAVVNVGTLLSSGFDETISRLTVTETRGSVYVNSISYEVSTVPEPATLALLGMGFLAVFPMQKHK